MGIGMALLEHTEYDPQNGAPINSSFGDYLVAVNADAPAVEVHFLDFPDKEINELGARGVGEIGLAGIAAAITDAVHHATGVRAEIARGDRRLAGLSWAARLVAWRRQHADSGVGRYQSSRVA
jgi:Molybdopterin-binding domain of aldehyde dehydrogenase